jgi:acetyltransferase-like isoleucine patch superfamily enzyme
MRAGGNRMTNTSTPRSKDDRDPMTAVNPLPNTSVAGARRPGLQAAIFAWMKARNSPLARAAYTLAKSIHYASFPVIPGLHRALFALHQYIRDGLQFLLRFFWYTPLFQSRLERPTRHLYVDNGMPYIVGPVRITLGENCRVAGQLAISGRSAPGITPELKVGDNVDLGWDGNIAVGRRIEIGNNVRLAPGVYLLGYPGHPIDAEARAAGAMDTEDQVGDIILEDDVWLGSRSTVMAGVRIGRGTVVAAGSIVTRDLPPYVLAAGIPAVIKKRLRDTP